jgi:Xaa-Pro dipeptidase
LDWLVLFHPVSIRWLTGSDAKSYQEFQCLFVPRQGLLTIMAREGERNEILDDALVDRIVTFGGGENEDAIALFERLADELGLLHGRCGIEVPAYYLHPHHYNRIRQVLGSSLAQETTNLVPDLALVKSPAEIAYIRRASAIADEAMTAFIAGLRPGRSEIAVAGDVYASLFAHGSFLSASPINLVSGERSGYSHGAPSERILSAGDYGSVEYGATFRRYTATIGRQFCLGRPTPRMRELHEIARRACDACMAEIRDGAPATAPHEAAKRVIGAAGLEHGRVHTSGYGLAPGFPPSWGEPAPYDRRQRLRPCGPAWC